MEGWAEQNFFSTMPLFVKQTFARSVNEDSHRHGPQSCTLCLSGVRRSPESLVGDAGVERTTHEPGTKAIHTGSSCMLLTAPQESPETVHEHSKHSAAHCERLWGSRTFRLCERHILASVKATEKTSRNAIMRGRMKQASEPADARGFLSVPVHVALPSLPCYVCNRVISLKPWVYQLAFLIWCMTRHVRFSRSGRWRELLHQELHHVL